ncbi:MAG: hypothetical protein U9N51_02125 [Bacteroidota bacterium]|nr:hypothetical protein [Bacteroidota bacterium]
MKKVLIWIFAVVITLAASYYQRKTGPTYPLNFKTEIHSETYAFELTRSASHGDGCMVELPTSDRISHAKVLFKKYPGNFEFDTIIMVEKDDQWIASLPIQPAAGKLQYYVLIYDESDVLFSTEEIPAIVRFKGDVPVWALIPHVLAMFFAMLLSAVALLMAIFNVGNIKRIAIWTFSALAIGGFIFGPIVQYFAFGQAWTGFPVGYDLTDNKTLIAGVFWLAAMLLNLKQTRRWIIILSGIVLLGIFTIPHSVRGSEYNYEAETIETGNK